MVRRRVWGTPDQYSSGSRAYAFLDDVWQLLWCTASRWSRYRIIFTSDSPQYGSHPQNWKSFNGEDEVAESGFGILGGRGTDTKFLGFWITLVRACHASNGFQHQREHQRDVQGPRAARILIKSDSHTSGDYWYASRDLPDSPDGPQNPIPKKSTTLQKKSVLLKKYVSIYRRVFF